MPGLRGAGQPVSRRLGMVISPTPAWNHEAIQLLSVVISVRFRLQYNINISNMIRRKALTIRETLQGLLHSLSFELGPMAGTEGTNDPFSSGLGTCTKLIEQSVIDPHADT